MTENAAPASASSDSGTAPAIDNRVKFEKIPNARDLGGRQGAAGATVKSGKVFRSTELAFATDADKAKIAQLGITQIFDLRTAAEVAQSPEAKIDGVTDTHLDVLADTPDSMASKMKAYMGDEDKLKALTEEQGSDLMKSTYVDIVSSASGLASYRAFFLDLLSNNGGALFHCTTGKDRTGWAAASFYSLMGVDREAIYEDYLQTNTDLLPALKPIIEQLKAKGLNEAFLDSILGVEKVYLDTAFTTVDNKFGAMDDYFTRGLKLDAATQDQLREKFLN